MTRFRSCLVVLAFWAAIYLPGLGAPELKGEEGRRILPALTMLESGNWLVPYIGGEPYFRKPPLINWLIAGTVKLTGYQNEWTVRLPSVLCVLALGLVITAVCTRWLGPRAALAASLFAIANVSMIEKGRLAEIEAIYVALSGIAMVIWMAWALQEDRSKEGRVNRWLVWTVPFVFLGLAALAKGPVHLLFFYAVVLATRRGRREFFSLPHLAGVLIMAAIFASWALPYFEAAQQMKGNETEASAAGVWWEQAAERFGGGSFVLVDWLSAVPRGFSNFLPWLLLVPVLWMRPAPDAWFRPVRNVVTAVYIGFLLIPGFLPRYTMPLLIPASVLLAVALREPLRVAVWPAISRFLPRVPGLEREPDAAPHRVAMDGWAFAQSGGVLAVAGILVFAFVILPFATRADDVRPLGRAISDAIPPGEKLFVFDPGYQAALFYVRPPIVYENEPDRLPDEVPFLLCRERAAARLKRDWEQVKVLQEFKDKEGRRLQLVSLAGRK